MRLPDNARMQRHRFLPWLLLLCLAASLSLWPAQAENRTAATAAAEQSADEPPLPPVDELRRQLDALPQKIGEQDDGRKLLAEVNAIGAAAERLAARRTADLADVDLRLSGLGPAPEKGSPADTPDVAEQRAALNKQRTAIDAELKLARLVAVDAAQRGTDLIRQRRALFQAQLTTRTDSPLGIAFWRNLRNSAPADGARLRALAGELRRSLLAASAIAANVLIISAALQFVWSAVALGGPLPENLRALQQATLRAAAYAAFAITLGHALLSPRRSSWRLLPISDGLARRLARFPWWVGLLSALGVLVADVNDIVGASLAAEVLVHAAFALLVSATMAMALGRMRVGEAQPDAPPQPLWVGLLLAGAGIAVAAAVLAVALGFVALAGTLARQMAWSSVVFASIYLLAHLADDLCDAILSSRGGFGARIHATLGIDAPLLDQAAVLISGVLRVALFFYMLIALMAPFGTGPDELFRRGTNVDHSLRIGDLALAPQALFTALAVVCGGFLAIRMSKRWLTERYFPHTTLEPGMRSSIVTLLGYVGGVVVIAVALAGLGISVERIAWVASALSVGIGFGLQAIVQNFISGLILLAERPVKVGDWVVLGDTEGDVRRVNVRATEIQLGDRSTVIVPNSEFITKTVRNMTAGSAQGRVLLRLPAPLDTDARHMRELILQAFQAHQAVLEAPAPSVTLEGIQSGTLTFLAIGYVGSPRDVGGVRSDLLFAILDALREAGLALSPPATTSVAQAQREPPAEPPPLSERA